MRRVQHFIRPFEQVYQDASTVAALTGNLHRILTEPDENFCCANMRMYVIDGKLGGGANAYPGCSYRGDCCILTKPIHAPIDIGQGRVQDLPTQEYPSVAAWLAAAKHSNLTTRGDDTVPDKQMRFAAYSFLAHWKGVRGRVCFDVYYNFACIFMLSDIIGGVPYVDRGSASLWNCVSWFSCRHFLVLRPLVTRPA